MEKFDLAFQFDEQEYKVTVVKYSDPAIKFEVIGNCLQDFGLSESFWLFPDKEAHTIDIDHPEAAELKTTVAKALLKYCEVNNITVY